uniref:translation initiation factor IF-2-like n=1 Tax=Callithrix jacchus TaxID=9483 RepID=UPI0004F0B6D9|nr:translation initiation factor IF-2-like [Callithrix jacchus]
MARPVPRPGPRSRACSNSCLGPGLGPQPEPQPGPGPNTADCCPSGPEAPAGRRPRVPRRPWSPTPRASRRRPRGAQCEGPPQHVALGNRRTLGGANADWGAMGATDPVPGAGGGKGELSEASMEPERKGFWSASLDGDGAKKRGGILYACEPATHPELCCGSEAQRQFWLQPAARKSGNPGAATSLSYRTRRLLLDGPDGGLQGCWGCWVLPPVPQSHWPASWEAGKLNVWV